MPVMIKIFVIFVSLVNLSFFSKAQKDQKVFTSDIDNFWTAYDSIQSTKDSLKQIDFIQKLYIDKGTKGLKAFMAVRNYTANFGYNLFACIQSSGIPSGRILLQLNHTHQKLKEV
jgi:hypothetical protein